MPGRRAVFAASVLILVWQGFALAATPAGSVVSISGVCFVEAAGRRTPLKLGAEVHVADTVDVPAGARLKLRMSDGSVVSIAAGSQVTIGTYTVDDHGKRHDAVLSLGQGLLHAVVAPVYPPASFEVDTAAGAAGARATDWFVEAQPGETIVGVLSGSVSLTSKATGAAVLIPARSGAQVSAGEDPTAPHRWRQAQFDALLARTDPVRRRARPPAGEPIPEYPPPGGSYAPPAPPGGSYTPPAPPSPGGSYAPPLGGGYAAPPPGNYRPPPVHAPPGGDGRNPVGTAPPGRY